MPPIHLSITGDDIATWADQRIAEEILPKLVRRLLTASTPAGTSIQFRADSGVRLPGYDGLADLTCPVERLPVGPSAWEVSVRRDVVAKAQSDYEERSASPGHVLPSVTTYVAVTGRRWPRKQDWEVERRKDGRWAEVVALDADDIAAWLEGSPSIAVWFARILGRPVDDILDLDTYLRSWCNRTNPPLPHTVLLAGREREIEAVRVWVEGPPKLLVVQGETPDEALHFVAAAIAKATTAAQDRALIVSSTGALNWTLRDHAGAPLLILPNITDRDLVIAAANRHLVLAYSHAQRPQHADICLSPIDREALAQLLVRVARPGEARQIAYASGGSMGALQRALGHIEAPAWAQGRLAPELIGMLLAGSWTPGNVVDEQIISSLAGGRSVTNVARYCAELRATPATPVRMKDKSWTWRSATDAWRLLIDRLVTADLVALEHAALDVLKQDDPTAGMELTERMTASFRGLPPRASPSLRLGLATSLALLSNSDVRAPALGGPSDRRDRVAAVVRQILSGDWRRWASIGAELPALAEAAPEAFLGALSESLDSTDGAARLLSVGEGALGRNPHVSTIWALERLAWDSDRLPVVALLLARLAERDPGGNVHPRPLDSVVAILRDFWPQTRASSEERLAAIDGIRRHHPEVAWQVGIKLLPELMGWHLRQTECPRFLPGEIPELPKTGQSDPNYISSLLERFLSWAADDPALWGSLLMSMKGRPTGWTLKVLTYLEERADALRTIDVQAKIWGSLRGLARWLGRREGSGAEVEQGIVARARALHDRFTPADAVLRVAWLFCHRPELLENLDAREEAERWQPLRCQAAAEILGSPNRQAALMRLAAMVEAPFLLGWALAEVGGEDIDALVFELRIEERKWKDLLQGFVAIRGRRMGEVWLSDFVSQIANRHSVDMAAAAALEAPPSSRLWDLLERIDQKIVRSYWRQTTRFFHLSSTGADRAIRTLISMERPALALQVLSDHLDDLNRIEPELALMVLETCKEHQEQLSSEIDRGMLDYFVERALSCADGGGPEIQQRIVAIEVFFLPVLREGQRQLRLFSLLAEDPSLFVELVRRAYRSDDYDHEPPPDESEQATVMAAIHILHDWSSWPGKSCLASEQEAALQRWVDRVLAGLVAQKRLVAGVAELARMLARVPSADGKWPCAVARRLVEANQHDGLTNSLLIAKRNLRGITSRPVGEGGDQERSLADEYRKQSASLANQWPKTAAMLRTLAGSYDRQAEDMDCQAEADRDP